jgi:hypothetical protein
MLWLIDWRWGRAASDWIGSSLLGVLYASGSVVSAGCMRRCCADGNSDDGRRWERERTQQT